jgi:hypothetical protein
MERPAMPTPTLRDNTEFQPLPAKNLWPGHLDLTMKELTQLPAQPVKQQPTSVYSYVVTSIHLDEEQRLRQRGSGPNFQGGRITLCTCKHRMRAALEVEQWPGQWIVGLSSRRRYQNRHWLVFITRVQEAYASHAELWQALPAAARRAKSARQHIHGDLFEPRERAKAKSLQASPFDPESYHDPIEGHRHELIEQWQKDVASEAWGRRSALLVGDPAQSWIWTEPRLFYKRDMTQGYTKFPSLPEFLAQLEEAR